MASYDYDLIENVNCSKELILLDIKKREYLNITLKGSGQNKLLVIMMNPSEADEESSDETINKIVHYFGSKQNKNTQGIKNILVVNLFPICCGKSKELNLNIEKINNSTNGNNMLIEMLEKNRKEIEKRIIDCNYIILGWGNSPDNFHETTFHREIIHTIDTIKKYKKNEIYIFHVKNTRANARRVSSENELTDRKNPVHISNGNIIKLLKIKIDNLYRIILC